MRKCPKCEDSVLDVYADGYSWAYKCPKCDGWYSMTDDVIGPQQMDSSRPVVEWGPYPGSDTYKK